MTKKDKVMYNQDHILAKVICCLINTLLVILYINTGSVILLILANITYFFGVNTLAYVIEAIRHHKHKHSKI